MRMRIQSGVCGMERDARRRAAGERKAPGPSELGGVWCLSSVCEVSITEEQILSEEGYSSRSQIRARRVQYRLRSELEPRRIQQLQPDSLRFVDSFQLHAIGDCEEGSAGKQ